MAPSKRRTNKNKDTNTNNDDDKKKEKQQQQQQQQQQKQSPKSSKINTTKFNSNQKLRRDAATIRQRQKKVTGKQRTTNSTTSWYDENKCFITDTVQNEIEHCIRMLLVNDTGITATEILNGFETQLDLIHINLADIERCFNDDDDDTNNNAVECEDDNDNDKKDTNTIRNQLVEQKLISLALRMHVQTEKARIVFQMIDTTQKQFIIIDDLRCITNDIFGFESNNNNRNTNTTSTPIPILSDDDLNEMIQYYNPDGIMNINDFIKVARTINL